jgi:NAD(P)-dependent dehydrogenase (short-subunit alcohol dehydrogenase family)
VRGRGAAPGRRRRRHRGGQAGARLAIVDLRAERAARVAGDLERAGHVATPLAVDVGDRAEVARAFHEIDGRFGRVDLLVNCAGRSMLVPFLDMTDEDLDWVLGPNFLGVVHCTRAAVPLMSPGSRIVNVTSVSGRVPTPGEAFYSACKAAVVSLSESLEAELAGRGIGVTIALPGEMSTGLFAEHPSWERRPDFQRRMEVPPERVAEAIVRAVSRDRFEVVDRASMRATLLVQRAVPRLFRWGVGRYWRTLEPRIATPEPVAPRLVSGAKPLRGSGKP